MADSRNPKRDEEFARSDPYRAYGPRDLERIPQIGCLTPEHKLVIQAVSKVLPFRVNRYVLDELIDWNNIPQDPIFQLTFPQREMLDPSDFRRMRDLVHSRAPRREVTAAAREIQSRMNPHPSGQMELNVPLRHGRALRGIQHKYRETVLFFPSQGQTCHAYCTYCFRWAQFIGERNLKFGARKARTLVNYLRRHPEVTDVLITGGDPLIMKTSVLRRYIEPLLEGDLKSLSSIRFGTKSLAYWPQRFLTDDDAEDLLRLFEQIRERGLHVAVMAHYSHPREMETLASRKALQRILGTGAVVRAQAPLVRRVNDRASVWERLWKTQVREGVVPYYMFVERDTGPKGYFEVPLARALDIFQEAYQKVSGLARTVRGPSMSATPGKVLIEAKARIYGEDVFVLKFIQGRDPAWIDRAFFARFDRNAVWLDDLEPAFQNSEFFFERPMRLLAGQSGSRLAEFPDLAETG
jgi:KamA family protein